MKGNRMKRSKMLSKEWYENWFSGKEKILGFNVGRPHPGRPWGLCCAEIFVGCNKFMSKHA